MNNLENIETTFVESFKKKIASFSHSDDTPVSEPNDITEYDDETYEDKKLKKTLNALKYFKRR